MFEIANYGEVKKMNKEIKEAKISTDIANGEIDTLKDENKELKTQLEEQKIQEKRTSDEVEHANRLKENEVQMQIDKAIKSVETAKLDAETKLEIANKEVEILRTAFENLGFDVKDMKSILDKLVDGIVSGNTVQVIK